MVDEGIRGARQGSRWPNSLPGSTRRCRTISKRPPGRSVFRSMSMRARSCKLAGTRCSGSAAPIVYHARRLHHGRRNCAPASSSCARVSVTTLRRLVPIPPRHLHNGGIVADDTERVAALLHEVAETHHIVYRIVDGEDPDWASWYADWLLNLSKLSELLGSRPVRSELVYALVRLDKDYVSAKPAEPWEAWYARGLVELLTP